MPPRSSTNPAPITESAKQARKAFYCELCQKGYARQNEFEAHESSYDHNHKRRLKDLQAMKRNMGNATAEKTRDKGAGGMIKINSNDGDVKKGGGTIGAGFKKSGFKSIVQTVGQDGQTKEEYAKFEVTEALDEKEKDRVVESDTDDEGYEVYNPRKPTGCHHGCEGRL